ncbi:hypothetical protein GCM10027299_08210 [Larkinella ripae]
MYFIVEQDQKTQGRYQVRLMDEKHKTLMLSELLSTKTACDACIRMVKRAAAHPDNFILWDIEQHRFNLFLGDGSLMIGAGRYKSAAERDAAISLHRLAILEAEVIDYTQGAQQAA